MASNSNFDGFSKLRKKLEELSNYQGRVGWSASAKTKDGKKIVDVAMSQEFGSPKGAPPRAFMRTAISENANKWMTHLQTNTKAYLHGSTSARNVFSNTAQMAADDIKQTLKKTAFSPKKEKSSQQPDQTDLLIQTLTSEVKQKGGA